MHSLRSEQNNIEQFKSRVLTEGIAAACYGSNHGTRDKEV